MLEMKCMQNQHQIPYLRCQFLNVNVACETSCDNDIKTVITVSKTLLPVWYQNVVKNDNIAWDVVLSMCHGQHSMQCISSHRQCNYFEHQTSYGY